MHGQAWGVDGMMEMRNEHRAKTACKPRDLAADQGAFSAQVGIMSAPRLYQYQLMGGFLCKRRLLQSGPSRTMVVSNEGEPRPR